MPNQTEEEFDILKPISIKLWCVLFSMNAIIYQDSRLCNQEMPINEGIFHASNYKRSHLFTNPFLHLPKYRLKASGISHVANNTACIWIPHCRKISCAFVSCLIWWVWGIKLSGYNVQKSHLNLKWERKWRRSIYRHNHILKKHDFELLNNFFNLLLKTFQASSRNMKQENIKGDERNKETLKQTSSGLWGRENDDY